MDWEGSGFVFFQEKLPRISMEKLKTSMFVKKTHEGPNVWRSAALTEVSNYKLSECEKEIEELLKSFRQLRAWMSVKLHFLRSHLDCFLKNCGDLSEKQGEYFHQDICNL